MSYGKLVRDKIPEIIIKNGEKPITRILDDQEYVLELEKKLMEEANEVLTAKGKERLEELADLLEVMESLACSESSSLEEVLNIKQNKKQKRGGFEEKIYLEGVEKKE